MTIYTSLKNIERNVLDHLVNDGVKEEDSRKIANNIVKGIKRFLLYISIGIIYFFITLILIINIFHKFIQFVPSSIKEQLGLIIAFGGIFLFLYAPPFLQYLGYEKLKETILNSFDEVFRLTYTLINHSIYMVGEFIGFLTLLFFLDFVNRINIIHVNIILYNVIFIFIYQLFISRYILRRIFMIFDRYIYKDSESSYKLHKNSNYISMVVIILISYMSGNYDSEILYALTLAFLFDTYIENRTKIVERIR